MRWIKSREHSGPWFLVFEDGAWRLDLSGMQSAIRVGRGNAWRFADGPPARYRFAFADWRFDKTDFRDAVLRKAGLSQVSGCR